MQIGVLYCPILAILIAFCANLVILSAITNSFVRFFIVFYGAYVNKIAVLLIEK
jgi:hypothetical protein